MMSCLQRWSLIVAVSLAASIWSGPALAQGPAGEPAKPLYERLGGLKGITLVVDDFIDRLVKNSTLNLNPEINAGRKLPPAPYLKFHVSTLVCEVTGGPCKYIGKDMKSSHAHMNITEGE